MAIKYSMNRISIVRVRKLVDHPKKKRNGHSVLFAKLQFKSTTVCPITESEISAENDGVGKRLSNLNIRMINGATGDTAKGHRSGDGYERNKR